MTKKGKQPPTATLKGVSPQRAQDWITSVINPVVGALQRETRFLPDGPWFWHHRARKLELLDKIPAYVSEFYLPNLDDLLRKQPRLAAQFKVHDEGIGDLAKAVEASFDRLMGPQERRSAITQSPASSRKTAIRSSTLRHTSPETSPRSPSASRTTKSPIPIPGCRASVVSASPTNYGKP